MMNAITDILDLTVFVVGDTVTTVRACLTAIVILFATYVLARLAKKAIGRTIDRVDGLDNSRRMLGFFVGLIVWLVGFEIALHLLGLNLNTVFAASGFLAFGAGFAAKNIVENFLSGVILRIERTIRPGDVIIVQEKWMTVSRIGSRVTVADTFDGEEILIPNSVITQSMVTNLTRRDSLFRLQAEVGVAYDSDLKEVRRVLEDAVKSIEWCPDSQTSGVYLHQFADSSVVYKITTWARDLDNARSRKSDLLETIWWALKDKGITIAFPQLDVHIDRHTPDANAE